MQETRGTKLGTALVGLAGAALVLGWLKRRGSMGKWGPETDLTEDVYSMKKGQPVAQPAANPYVSNTPFMPPPSQDTAEKYAQRHMESDPRVREALADPHLSWADTRAIQDQVRQEYLDYAQRTYPQLSQPDQAAQMDRARAQAEEIGRAHV